MVVSAEYATLSERLEAAAISWMMIAAIDPGAASLVATIAARFGVDEQVLLRAARSNAARRTYDRIHARSRPLVDLGAAIRIPADASRA
jgi:hypothetical protein